MAGAVAVRTLLILALALRALIPAGYMPAPLASGAPFAVCPVASAELYRWITDAAPAAAAAGAHAHRHRHPQHSLDGAHGSAGAAAEDGGALASWSAAASCPFAAWLSAAPLPALPGVLPEFSARGQPFTAAPAPFLRSLARVTRSARGPPRA